MNSRIKRLQTKVNALPDSPGVYLMKNKEGKIIYVGKAKKLKNRVRSYFSLSKNAHFRTAKLVEQIEDFDVILTKTEVEALFTERTLIRHNSPAFNVLLRDDKEYPFIRVDFKEDWPRIEKVRKRKEDGAKYFGPFGSAGQLSLMLKSIGRIFPLIRCSRHEFKNARRPCTYYHMKMCLAPCVYEEVSSDEYKAMIQDALSVLEGKSSQIKEKLHQLMQDASEKMRYEAAAKFRDQIVALEKVHEKQAAVVKTIQDADVIQLEKQNEFYCFMILMIRENRLVGNDHFVVEAPAGEDDQVLSSFILQYYDGHSLPPELIVPMSLPDSLEEALNELALGKSIKIAVPQKGDRKKLLELATKNGRYQLDEASRTKSGMKASLEMLQKFLELENFPRRMECIDISNMQGQAIVASDVCFIEGRPAQEQYRIYNVKTVQNKNDDFASIEEVVERRIRRGIESFDMPDLLVIDGGKGQLNAALKAASQFPNLNMEIVSIAKSRTQKTSINVQSSDVERSYERIFKPGEESPRIPTPGSVEFRLLTHIRDEAHRFAIQHHRRKRQNKMFSSELDLISGVGPKMKKKILEHFGTVDKVKKAHIDQLRRVPGVSDKLANEIHRFFNQSD